MKKFISIFMAVAAFFAVSCTKAQNEAYEAFDKEFRTLQEMYTQVYNATVMNEEYEDAMYDGVKEECAALLSGINELMDNLSKWADESYAKHKLDKELDEILAAMHEGPNAIEVLLTQVLNYFNDQVAILPMIQECYMAIESLQQSWTMVYNLVCNNEEDQALYGTNAAYISLVDDLTATLSGISQNIDALSNLVDEAAANGNLQALGEDFYFNMESIQMQISQVYFTYLDGVEALAE